MIFTLIVALVLAIVSVIFALQNSDVIKVVFFSLKMEGPFALFVLASLAIGVVIGILVMVPSVIKNAITISRHRKQIDGLQKSLKEQTPPVIKQPAPAPEIPVPAVPPTPEAPEQIEE
jgi:uncharacterized integral membrane protein